MVASGPTVDVSAGGSGFGAAGFCRVSTAATAVASAPWVNGDCGANDETELPRTPTCVTARICAAAQFSFAAEAVHESAPQSRLTTAARRSILTLFVSAGCSEGGSPEWVIGVMVGRDGDRDVGGE